MQHRSNGRWIFLGLLGVVVMSILVFAPVRRFSTSAVSKIFSPIVRPFHLAGTWVRGGMIRLSAWEGAIANQDAIEHLAVDKAVFESLKKENADFRALLAIRASTKRNGEYAEVTGGFHEDRDEYITIATSGEIPEGSVVLSPSGILIGIVRTSTADQATVRLISSPSETVTVSILPANAEGVLVGDNNGEYQISLIPGSAQVHTGDPVLSAGRNENILPGTLIGYVAEALYVSGDTFLSVRAKVPLDAMNLDHVFVIE
ncbi:MAG: rod shape-determining protein MreC [Candidatus Sungbacteria bacterium]|uniref:Cell shape-determining protein MreC n=1 Tax=Candidatus Sungiibacteriota bacterium TaxID=2750080 RepID=A0A9D6LUH9_9BACT|nr:rod shape-determining protein MreC [Candidatus Sungbacteria bacterium]